MAKRRINDDPTTDVDNFVDDVDEGFASKVSDHLINKAHNLAEESLPFGIFWHSIWLVLSLAFGALFFSWCISAFESDDQIFGVILAVLSFVFVAQGLEKFYNTFKKLFR